MGVAKSKEAWEALRVATFTDSPDGAVGARPSQNERIWSNDENFDRVMRCGHCS